MDPETRYLRTTDGVHIAYQVIGDGSYGPMYQTGWQGVPDRWRLYRVVA